MSFTDPEAEPVQPEGQGGEAAASDAPYAEYLNRIPEEVRGDVEPIFKEWDSNTTRKFQDASEYRRGWEPYEQLGVNQQDPAEVEWALQMLEAAKTNPQSVQTWYQDYAQQHGLTPAEAQQQLEDEQGYVDPSITQALERELSTHLGPVQQQLQEFAQWRDAQVQQADEARVQGEIRSELDSLKSKHSDFDESLVDKFIANHMSETDPRVAVQKAFADAQALVGQIEKRAFNQKVDSPQAAEAGGATASGAEPITSLKQAGEIAKRQLREINRA